MASNAAGYRLREILQKNATVVAPGAFDAVSARLVEEAGYPVVYIGSYATSASAFGLPDAGLVSMREIVDHARTVVGAVSQVPVVADAEGGFGNAAQVWRAIREFEGAGVAAIHIEDHEFGKHMPVPSRLIARSEMKEKVAAAVEARQGDLLVIARTDAYWATGGNLGEAVARACAYAEAGADLAFLAGVPSPKLGEVKDDIPIPLVNTNTGRWPFSVDEENGVKLVLCYSCLLYASYRAGKQLLERMRDSGGLGPLTDLLVPEPEFDEFIGFPRIEALAARHGLA
ncbi:MAG TPA: isocitrate lyase/PEP mutase family protein, partial [Firmicutes bacterium]|nr:isocitrate lyase/PEP mutase family protein [Bacillota bacterium]